jgi:hypothetical protein
MMRRLFAVAAVLLLSGLVPLAASAGLCATKRCCRSRSHATATVGANSECCNPTSCGTDSRDVDVTSAKSAPQTQHIVAAISAQKVVIGTTPSNAPVRVDSGPPPLTRERLATLSILLV